MDPVVALDDALSRRAAGHDVRFADVRWYLDGRDGRQAFETGHIPGAVFVDLDTELSRHDLTPLQGRHPFPTPEQFAESMGGAGIGDGTEVVAYDDAGGLVAGRLVVMLRMLGARAALLDGGLGAWPGELERGPGVAPAPATFTTTQWPTERLVDAAGAARAASAGRLLDARPRDRFTGDVIAMDARAGHIPGARSAPWSEVLDATGRVRPPAELRRHFAGLGVREGGPPPVAACGSGVSACLDVLAIEQAGLGLAQLYVASWSGWSADPARPVETGPGR